jgi:O-antigen ligase
MLYLNGAIGVIFIVIALLHAPHPDPFSWAPYLGAALLALVSCRREISMGIARALAILTMVSMFYFFAAFFVHVPRLAADWYQHQEGWNAVCEILAAFAMIPILSDFSCRLKAECREARAARRAFFSVPSDIQPQR